MDTQKRMTLKERLDRMSPEELRAALRRTAEYDRTYRAQWFAEMADDRAEARAAIDEMYRFLALQEADT